MEREESFPTWHCDVPTKQAQKTIPNPPQDKWGGGKEAVKVGREWWGGKTEWEQWRKRRLKRKRRRARESDREKKCSLLAAKDESYQRHILLELNCRGGEGEKRKRICILFHWGQCFATSLTDLPGLNGEQWLPHQSWDPAYPYLMTWLHFPRQIDCLCHIQHHNGVDPRNLQLWWWSWADDI